jgi:hypothetical protein
MGRVVTYAQFDDNFTSHPKIAPLSDRAFRLHVTGILYCSRHRTDGIVSATIIPSTVARHNMAIAELVDRALWLPLDDGRYYEIHDYLDWNKSRAEIDKLAAARADAARKRWGRK